MEVWEYGAQCVQCHSPVKYVTLLQVWCSDSPEWSWGHFQHVCCSVRKRKDGSSVSMSVFLSWHWCRLHVSPLKLLRGSDLLLLIVALPVDKSGMSTTFYCGNTITRINAGNVHFCKQHTWICMFLWFWNVSCSSGLLKVWFDQNSCFGRHKQTTVQHLYSGCDSSTPSKHFACKNSGHFITCPTSTRRNLIWWQAFRITIITAQKQP